MKPSKITISRSLIQKILMDVYIAGTGHQNYRNELSRAMKRIDKNNVSK